MARRQRKRRSSAAQIKAQVQEAMVKGNGERDKLIDEIGPDDVTDVIDTVTEAVTTQIEKQRQSLSETAKRLHTCVPEKVNG